MSATLPPTPLQTSSTPNTAAITSGTGQIQMLPPAVNVLLQKNKPVQAEVTAKPQPGQVTVQTPQGEIRIQTAVPLSVGTKIALSLPPESTNPPQTVTIKNLTADPVKAASMPPQEKPASPLVPIASGTGQMDQAPKELLTQLAAGQNLTSEVIAKPEPGKITLQLPPSIGSGKIEIQTLLPLAVGTKVSLAMVGTNGPPYSLNIQHLSEPKVENQIATPPKLPAIATLPTKVTSVPVASGTGSANSLPEPAISLMVTGKTLTAQVIAKPQPSQIVVQTAQGNISINTLLPLPEGATLNLAMSDTKGPPFHLKIQYVPKALIRPDTPSPLLSVPATSGTGEAQSLPQLVVNQFKAQNIVTAEVIAKPQPATIIVQTSQGKIEIQTPLPLPTGSTVNLALSGSDGPPFKLNIQHIPTPTSKPSPQPDVQPIQITKGIGEAHSLPQPILALLTSGNVVSAEVVARPQPQNVIVQAPQGKIDIKTTLPLPTGATINMAMSSPDGPPYNLNIQQVSPQPIKTDAPVPPAPTFVLVATGEALNLPQPLITHLASGNTLPAEVIVKPQPDVVTVQTPQGNFDIKTSQTLPLPTGSTVNLALNSAGGPPFMVNIQQSSPPAPAPVSISVGVTVSLPKSITALLTSEVNLPAQIIAKPQLDVITVKTPQGNFEIKTPQPLPLPTGSAINLSMNGTDGPPYKIDIQQIPSAQNKADANALPLSTPVTNGTGETQNLPKPAITLLLSGNIITADVIAKPTPGTVTLQLPQGKIDVKTPLPLPTGAKVNIAMSEKIGPPHKLNLQQVQAPPAKNEAPPQQGTGPQIQAGTAEVKALPQPVIATFESGKNIAADVTANPKIGQVTLQTSHGEIQAQTSLPLATGSSVLLSMASLNGPPFTLNIQQLGLTNNAPMAAKSDIVKSLTNGVTLNATIVKSNAGIPQQLAPPNTTTSTPLPTDSTSTASRATPQPSAVDGTAFEKTAVPSATTPVSQTGVKPQLPQGGTVPIKINAIQLPGGITLPAIPDGQLNLMQAEVISNANGQLVIQTENSTLSLSVNNPPPVGTLLLLSLEGLPVPPTITPQRLGGQEMMQRWEGLRDAMVLLEAGDPAAAAKVMQSMPQVGIKLTTSLMFFMNALRGGNVDNWFGSQNMQSLNKLSKSTADKVGSDFRATQGRATDSANNDWRSYNLPMFTDREIEQLRLYMKDFQEDDDEDASSKKGGKRFVIEVNFTKLGPFQFDGVAKEKTVDLMIRTHKPLEDGMRDDIRSLFSNTIAALGLTGSVGFHVSPKFDIHQVKEEITYGGGMTV